MVELYVGAFQRFDVEAIVALLHRDVVVSMPPFSAARAGCVPRLAGAGRRAVMRAWWSLRPTAAQRWHSTAAVRAATWSPRRSTSSRGDGRIGALHAFLDPTVFPMFGL